jgi:hypothetical protein
MESSKLEGDSMSFPTKRVHEQIPTMTRKELERNAHYYADRITTSERRLDEVSQENMKWRADART